MNNAHGKSISYNIDKIVFILFNTSCVLFFQFETFIIYCFHALFVFDCVLNVLIVAGFDLTFQK